MPTGTPATVPTAIAISEIRMLKAKPHSSSGAQRTRISMAEDLTAAGCCASAMVAPTPTMRRNSRIDAARWPGGRPSRRGLGWPSRHGHVSAGHGLGALLAEAGDDEAALDGMQDADQDEHQHQIGHEHEDHHLAHVGGIAPDLLGDVEQLRHGDGVGEVGGLDEVDEVVAERRQADADGDRQDDEAIGLPAR